MSIWYDEIFCPRNVRRYNSHSAPQCSLHEACYLDHSLLEILIGRLAIRDAHISRLGCLYHRLEHTARHHRDTRLRHLLTQLLRVRNLEVHPHKHARIRYLERDLVTKVLPGRVNHRPGAVAVLALNPFDMSLEANLAPRIKHRVQDD